jgi:hypothetical protein
MPDGALKTREPFWTTSKYGLRLVGVVEMSFKAGGWVAPNAASPAAASDEWAWTVGSAPWQSMARSFSIAWLNLADR